MPRGRPPRSWAVLADSSRRERTRGIRASTGAPIRSASSSSSPIRWSNRASAATRNSASARATTAAMSALRSGRGSCAPPAGWPARRRGRHRSPAPSGPAAARCARGARASTRIRGRPGCRPRAPAPPASVAFNASMARWMSACPASRRTATICSANALATAAAPSGVSQLAVTVPRSVAPRASTETASLSSSADDDAPSRSLTRTATPSSDASARLVAAARSGTTPVSVTPPAMMASAVDVRPNRRSAVAS